MDPIEPPHVAETHISYVFLVGDRAYKLKKPVRFDFLDLTEREARRRLCHREVELNRRLSPDVYLGVLDIVDASGDPVDHLVEMRRMPDDRRLSTMLAEGRETTACVHKLARDLAAFHAAAETSPEISAAGHADRIREAWDENFEEMATFVGDVLDGDTFDAIRRGVETYLSGRRALFGARVDGGRIRDGHGDLLADDIFCLDDGPRVLDCIEFNDTFRFIDTVSDIAFLAMDLERLGATDVAERFVAWYQEFSGDTYPRTLLDLYIAYRALVRSKVACLRAAQGDDAARRNASDLLALCARRIDAARVRMVLVGGLPGTGKSTLAAGLSDATGWAVLRSDEIRKDITGIPHATSAADRFGHGIYDTETTERTYDAMLKRARSLVENGIGVVLDASWSSAAHRERARRLAIETSSEVIEIRCDLPAEVAAERMARRQTSETDASDAGPDVAAAMASNTDPWTEAVPISTAPGRDAVLRLALRTVGS